MSDPEKRVAEWSECERKLGGVWTLCHHRDGVQCVRFPVARYTIPSAPGGGFIQDPGWLGMRFETYLGISKPCSQQTGADATCQKRLPSFEITTIPPFLENDPHYVPHGDLRRSVRRFTIGTRVPGDNYPKVLHVSWWVERLEKFKRYINFILGGWIRETHVELGFNFGLRPLLLLDDALSYGSGEPPRVLRRYMRKYVESFTLGVFRLRVRNPLKLLVIVFDDFGASICIDAVSSLANESRGMMREGPTLTIFSGDKPVPEFCIYPLSVTFEGRDPSLQFVPELVSFDISLRLFEA